MDSSSASELQAVSTQPLAIESAPTVVFGENEKALVPVVPISTFSPSISTENYSSRMVDVDPSGAVELVPAVDFVVPTTDITPTAELAPTIDIAPTVDTALPAELVPITDANAATPNLLGNDEMEKIGGKRKRRLSSPDDEFLIPHVKTSRRRTLSYM